MKNIILTLSLLLFSCNQDTKEKLVVYQSPTCGCCSGWVANMEQNGFNVEAIKTNDMETYLLFYYQESYSHRITLVIPFFNINFI